MNGQVIVLETTIPYHPMNSWSSFPKYRMNGFTHGIMDISVPLEERKTLGYIAQLKSEHILTGTFDIWDSRNKKIENRRYEVAISKGTNRAESLATEEYNLPDDL